MEEFPPQFVQESEHKGDKEQISRFLEESEGEEEPLRERLIQHPNLIHKAKLHRASLHVRVARVIQRGEGDKEDKVQVPQH